MPDANTQTAAARTASPPPGAGPAPRTRRRAAAIATLAIPALGTLWFSFNAGGFFIEAPALAAVLLLLAAAGRLLTAESPLAGLSRGLLAAGTLLSAYAAWTLLSAFWSHAPARALIEFDRALLYLAALLAAGMAGRRPGDLESALRLLAGALTAVCLAGLVTRVAPDVLSAPANVAGERLSYPVTYWNALGLMAAIALALCLHVAAAPRSGRLAAALGAAALPALAATLFFTFSRGSIVAAALAVGAYLVLARPWGAVAALLAGGPAVAIAVAASYRADLLATADPSTPEAVAQGHRLALVLIACTAVAGVVRLALAALSARVGADRRAGELVRRAPRAAAPALAAAAVAAVVVAALAAGVPAKAERQYDRFVAGAPIEDEGDLRGRLTNPGSNGRLDHWRVALDGFREQPLRGHGAGTYALQWAQRRPIEFTVLDAHSLYAEVAAELGAVGLALLGGTLLVVLAGAAGGLRGRGRATRAAVVAALLAWMLGAGIDWHWEMPAVTFWVFALGGLALARRVRDGEPASGPRLPDHARVAGAIVLGLIAVTPALAILSQRSLDDAVASFRRGDCASAIDHALASARWLRLRPEPFEVLGYCDVRLGEPALGVTALENAVDRDPRNWELHYGLALVRAADGRDPRPALREARRLNPRHVLPRRAAERFRGNDPQKWRRGAATAPLPFRAVDAAAR